MAIIILDDLTSRLYSKLKADSDKLKQIRAIIERKVVLIATHMDTWLEYNTLGMKEADEVFIEKYNLEVEVSKLRKDETVILDRIKSYVSKKT